MGDADVLRQQSAEENVSRHLAKHGLGVSAISGTVSRQFGEIVALIVGGSVPVGYANPRSDLDLYVVVDGPSAPGVPSATFELGCLADIYYFPLPRVVEAIEGFGRSTSPPRVLTELQAAYGEWFKWLDNLLRMRTGYMVDGSAVWDDANRFLPTSDLVEIGATSWVVEAARRASAARVLLPRVPIAAANAAYEALVAALKGFTMRNGFAYPNQKWVPTELAALDAHDLLVKLRLATELVPTPQAAAKQTAATLEVVDELTRIAPEGLTIQLAYAPGVKVQRIGGRSLVSRWEMRAVVIDAAVPPVPGDGEAIWEGADLGEAPDELQLLAAHDFLWIGAAGD